jgi:hypothetical protein
MRWERYMKRIERPRRGDFRHIFGTWTSHGDRSLQLCQRFSSEPADKTQDGLELTWQPFPKVSQFDFLVGFVKLERKGIY